MFHAFTQKPKITYFTLSSDYTEFSSLGGRIFSEVKCIVLGQGSPFLVRVHQIFRRNFFFLDDFAVMTRRATCNEAWNNQQHPRCKSCKIISELIKEIISTQRMKWMRGCWGQWLWDHFFKMATNLSFQFLEGLKWSCDFRPWWKRSKCDLFCLFEF